MKKTRMICAVAVLALAVGLGGTPADAGEKPLKKVTFLTNYVFHGRHSPRRRPRL